jgi:hypothetical protein
VRTTLALAVGVGVLVNELLLALGHLLSGTFTYTTRGQATEVTIVSVLVMTAGPLIFGVAMLAALARRRPSLVTAAASGGCFLALATIAVVTLPVNFDAASTACLALMHVVVGTTLVVAARRLVPSQPSSRTYGRQAAVEDR